MASPLPLGIGRRSYAGWCMRVSPHCRSVCLCLFSFALAALVRSAEKRFHISIQSLQEHSDPCSILQQQLDKGEVSHAYVRFL